MKDFVKIDCVEKYNELFGLETQHPLVSVVSLAEAEKQPVGHMMFNYGVYSLFLKNLKCGDILYGRQTYDYQEGTVTSFAPGQVVETTFTEGMKLDALGLLFHPDLIKGTSLGQNIRRYSFFSYSSNEALHLSDEEKEIFTDCLKKIKMEISRPVDKHSRRLISRNIELLLDYCMRFYERQFITRSQSNKNVIVKFESLLDDYFREQRTITDGLPTVMDASRVEQIVKLVAGDNFGQIFITDTNRDHLDKILKKIDGDYKLFEVEGGMVTERKEEAHEAE